MSGYAIAGWGFKVRMVVLELVWLFAGEVSANPTYYSVKRVTQHFVCHTKAVFF